MKPKFRLNFPFATIVILLAFTYQIFGTGAENIRLNQIGFYQYGPKTAIIVSTQAWRFSVKSQDLITTYYTGQVSQPKKWTASGEFVSIADFSEFTRPGAYVLEVGGIGTSYPFKISASVHSALLHGLLKAFYYQRASTDLPEQYAGKWNRSAGHPDMQVIVHASAASDSSAQSGRKEGETYASPGGWYDAGDYGKYVVNAGISTYTLLALYEQFPNLFDTLSLNIPRTYSALPDLLSEIKWELDWLLTMQDPADGGVYHKLTSLGFCGFIMPERDVAARYFIGKGTAAAFDFAAVCAVAARIYKKYADIFPGFSDSCIGAAKRAWAWGALHPNKSFSNPGDVTTGEYGDRSLLDEQNWAANELYIATNDTVYQTAAKKANVSYPVPSWPNISMLGMYSLAHVKNDSLAKEQILARANGLLSLIAAAPYRTLPLMSGDYYWGSNAVAANYGMTLIEAFLISKDSTYFNRAVDVLDYCVGRNAIGFCFVTGFGSKSPRYPHHRPSSADGIEAPVPGLLVGGPNANLKRDEGSACGESAYPSDMTPAKSWIENECSYAGNEVAINWNAPAAFLAGAIEAIYANPSYNVKRHLADTLLPTIDSVSITGLAADRAVIAWKTDKSVSASVQYALDSALTHAHQKFSLGTTRHSVSLVGLSPATRYFYRLSSIDDYGNVANGPVLSFTSPESPLLEGFSFTPASLSAIPGSDMVVAFQGKPGSSATLAYLKGGEALTQQRVFQETNGTFNATIPGADITGSGILLSITLKNGTDSVTTPVWAVVASSPINYSDTIAFGNAYNLLSLPTQMSIDKSFDFFSPQLGDSAFWRYFGFDASSGQYILNASIGGGKGGWLYIASEKRVISFETAAIKPDTLFPIALSKGWNCIGTPFPFPIFWENSMVRSGDRVMRISDNGARQTIRRQLFYYSDTSADRTNNGQYFSNRDILLSDTTRLLPYRGYWVYAEMEGVVLLANPSADKPAMSMAKKTDENLRQWQIRFSLNANGAMDNAAIIGESSIASDGYDEFDSPKPPTVSDAAIIGLQEPRWQGTSPLFASDIAHFSDNSRDYEWQIAAMVKHGPGNASVSWDASGTMNGFLYLHDATAGVTIDMTRASAYDFSLLPGETRRVMTVKKTAFKDTRFSSIPPAWSFRGSSPNPFKKATIFSFSVPGLKTGEIKEHFVTITVFDISGRRVRSLLRGYPAPGVHSVLWDGCDDQHQRLRHGVYIARFCSDGFSGSVMSHLVD
jgi:endoglucanase